MKALAANRDDLFENKAMYSEIMIPNEFISEFERENEIAPGQVYYCPRPKIDEMRIRYVQK